MVRALEIFKFLIGDKNKAQRVKLFLERLQIKLEACLVALKERVAVVKNNKHSLIIFIVCRVKLLIFIGLTVLDLLRELLLHI